MPYSYVSGRFSGTGRKSDKVRKKLGVGLTCDPVKKLIVSRKEEEEI